MRKRKQIAVGDIILAIAAEIALNATGPGHLQIKWKSCGDRKADETVERVIRALVAKHLRKTDNKGRRVDVREICRDLVLDCLSRKKSVAPYYRIIAGFAARDDQTFLRALGRLSERKRVVFDDTEWWLLLNWDSLEDKTDDEILAAYSKNGSIKVGALTKRRQRLGLSK
jgi:hypothetical protein